MTHHLLEVRGLGKRYSVPVLQDFDLTVEAGEVHALMGANGAGKCSGTTCACTSMPQAQRIRGRDMAAGSRGEGRSDIFIYKTSRSLSIDTN